MQWEILYAVPGTTDMWRGKRGRLFSPMPRSAKEVGKAVEEILELNLLAVVTITPLPETPVTKVTKS